MDENLRHFIATLITNISKAFENQNSKKSRSEMMQLFTTHLGPLEIKSKLIALPGFEPGSTDPKSAMIGHYTTGLCENLFPVFVFCWNSEKYFGSFVISFLGWCIGNSLKLSVLNFV